MVGRIQNRINNQVANTSSVFKPTNTQTIMATEGATALNIENVATNESKVEEKNEKSEERLIDNLSMENANYLQNLETNSEELNSQELTNFEVDSIEMATPQLFSNDETTDANSQELETKNTDIFDNQISQEISGEKEPEMFDSSESEEDFEIPAFLRKQKD